MSEPRASSLAGSFPAQAPGLPRGRGRMAVEQVRTAQRARILRAAISAFAEVGFPAATVADIVTRARVSRAAFYQQFTSKQECLLAAIDAGRDTLLPKITEAGSSARAGGFAGTVRAIVREYLRVCASEPEFTRVWTLELPTAGPEAMRRRHAYFDTLAAIARSAHATYRPGDEMLPDSMYLALIGGCHELFYRYVSDDRTTALPELEEPIVQFVLHWLG